MISTRTPNLSAVLIAGLLALAAPDASAEEPVYSFGPQTGWQATLGPTLGSTVGSDDNGFFVGGEVSLTRIREGIWWGLYSDATHTFADGSALVTAGPTLGWGLIGLDAGFAVRNLDGLEEGVTVRGLLTFGLLGAYGRWVHLPGPDDSFGQLGVYLKLPFWASTRR